MASDKLQKNLDALLAGPKAAAPSAPDLVTAMAQAIREAAAAANPPPARIARPVGWRVQVVRREGLIEEFLVYPMDARP